MKPSLIKPVNPKPACNAAIKAIAGFFFLSLLLLNACSSDSSSTTDDGDNISNDSPGGEKNEIAIVTTVAADFQSAAHAIVGTEAPYTTNENISPTVSDIAIAAFKNHFYRIERFNADNITKFSTDKPDTPIWQYQTLDTGDEQTGNPQTIIFLNENKAYILRHNKNTAWIVNPSATSQAEFKIGEIDLSAYDDGDGSPEMMNGLVVDGMLYIVMQRLDRNDGFNPLQAYIAVIDTSNDTEIDTQSNGNFKGIALPVKNPLDIQLLEDDGLLYVHGQGRFVFGGDPEFTGGITTVNPTTFVTDLVLDDGDANEHTFGQFTHMRVISANRGYFIGSQSFQNSAVYSFNPTTSTVDPTPVANIEGVDVTALAVDGKKRLWIAVGANDANGESAKLTIINPNDNTQIKDKIEMQLNPVSIVFAPPVAQ